MSSSSRYQSITFPLLIAVVTSTIGHSYQNTSVSVARLYVLSDQDMRQEPEYQKSTNYYAEHEEDFPETDGGRADHDCTTSQFRWERGLLIAHGIHLP